MLMYGYVQECRGKLQGRQPLWLAHVPLSRNGSGGNRIGIGKSWDMAVPEAVCENSL